MSNLLAGDGVIIEWLNGIVGGSARVRRKLNGFFDYNDTATAVTPITLPADTWVTVTNNGLGAFSNSSYPPTDVTNLMNTMTGDFDFSELELGDNVLVRNDFTVTPSVDNSVLELRYQLGTGPDAYTLEHIEAQYQSGSGKPYRSSLVPHMVYMGDTNTQGNPVRLQLKLSVAGTVVNAGSVVWSGKR